MRRRVVTVDGASGFVFDERITNRTCSMEQTTEVQMSFSERFVQPDCVAIGIGGCVRILVLNLVNRLTA